MKDETLDRLLGAALAEAQSQGVAVTISIVAGGGHLLALRRQQDSSFLGIESSKRKAVTASQLKTPTHVLSEIGQKLPELQKAFDKDHNILTIAGGFPIVADGVVIGGLGIAGGDFNQDKVIGESALRALVK